MNTKNQTLKFFTTKANDGESALHSFELFMRKNPAMTAEEELEAFKQYAIAKEELEKDKYNQELQNKVDNIKNDIVSRNQRFVYSLAKIYATSDADVLDYVNEGNFGLLEAVDKFDYTKGFKFITFAVMYIRREMNYYIMNTKNTIVKSNAMKIGKKAEAVRQAFYAENGYNPSDEEVMEILNEKYPDLCLKNTSDVTDINIASINESVDDDYTVEDDSLFNDYTSSVNEYEYTSDNEYKNTLVNSILSHLSEKQADIIKMAFGIDYDREYSSFEIGKKYNMYEEDIDNLKNKIITYLIQNKNEFQIAV